MNCHCAAPALIFWTTAPRLTQNEAVKKDKKIPGARPGKLGKKG
jgi:hypothetical protein